MVRILDSFLNSITMYRLVLYGLGVLLGIATLFAFLGLLPFTAQSLLISVAVLLVTCYASNYLFARLYQAPRNVESAYITALILACILPPPSDAKMGLAIGLAGVLAMASKFVLAIRAKHIFNPAAIGAVLIGLAGLLYSTWWIGSTVMLLFVSILGFMIVRKIRRFQMVATFLIVSVAIIVGLGLADGRQFSEVFLEAFTSWPIIFFATVMVTEPLTTPPRLQDQLVYSALVGLLFASRWHVGPFYTSPELALVVGNIFAYIVSPKQKLLLTLKEKVPMASNVYDFIFSSDKKLQFLPGQYLEWTLPHPGSDGRGNRRYFTIASAPTEQDIHLGVKYYQPSSSFKTALSTLNIGDYLYAGQLSGNFTLPKDLNQKLVFIAGGIGITPFRSMLKYCLDAKEKRDITLIYSISDPAEIVYKDVLEAAEKKGVKVLYLLRSEKVPKNWQGLTGTLTGELLEKEILDYHERVFYLSGPNAFVDHYSDLLRSVGVASRSIHKDYFPGY